jgi:4-diphosphocytidyl-2-C-methyl-D-erythritol kinase
MRLTRKAFAKINLGLRILQRLTDGYHAIETVFVELGWGDTLFVEPARNLRFHCRGIPVPAGENNLVLRAARLLQQKTHINQGADITLEKLIPVGAGLGGGSSDAAAALRLLSQLWEVNPGQETMASMARSLGADVPFFLSGGTAYATGIGDHLAPVKWDFEGWIVLYYPGWEASTPWAYRQWDLSEQAPKRPLPLRDYVDLVPSNPESRRIFANDFEAIVFGEFPALEQVYRQFWETGAEFVGLSGSGSALFALYTDRNRALAAHQWAQSQGWAQLTRRREGENLGTWTTE